MTPVPLRLVARGPLPAPDVWERYARPSAWPGWAPHLTAVACDADRIAPGVTGTVVGPVGVSGSFVVDAVDETAGTWTWTVRRGPLRVTLDHGVEPDGGGTRTWLDLRGPVWALPAMTGYLPLAKLALRRLVTP
jgi:hypothetical protein